MQGIQREIGLVFAIFQVTRTRHKILVRYAMSTFICIEKRTTEARTFSSDTFSNRIGGLVVKLLSGRSGIVPCCPRSRHTTDVLKGKPSQK